MLKSSGFTVGTALRTGTYFVAGQDLILGLIGLIAITVLWTKRRTKLPMFGGRFVPITPAPGKELRFVDDPNKTQFVILGLTLLAGFMFLFGILLLKETRKKNTFFLQIWVFVNIFCLGCGICPLIGLAFTEYASAALICSIPLMFRGWEIWVVMAFQDNIVQTRRWELAQIQKQSEVETRSAHPQNANPGDSSNPSEPEQLNAAAATEQQQNSVPDPEKTSKIFKSIWN